MTERKLDNPAFREMFLKELRDGSSRAGACHSLGISPTTFYNHLRSDPDFSEQVLQAELVAEDKLLKGVYADALAGDPRARETWLKWRAKDRPSERVEVHHTGEVLTDGDRGARLQALQQRWEQRALAAAEEESDGDY